jgi:hypothetical protein
VSTATYLVPCSHRPDWVEYPHSYCRIVEQALVDLRPWHVLESDQALLRYQGLASRYPSRELFPFAYRQDNDDVACWSKGMGERVVVIHDFAAPGFEVEDGYDDVWSWFRSAIEETISWD